MVNPRIVILVGCALAIACSSSNRTSATNIAPTLDAAAPGGNRKDAAASSGTETDAAGDSGVSSVFPPALDARALGKADVSKLTFAAFSQVGTSSSDPQVLDLLPDVVPRAWSQWDIYGTQPGDYNFAYTKNCQAAGITFIGGLTASVIFQDEMGAADFTDEVGRDAQDNPVPHPEVATGAYRGSLASPGFRQRLIDIAKIQIDGGVDGLFFDEVNSSYIGANYDGDEGFDDYDVADFGRYLCAKYMNDPSTLDTFDLAPEDALNCNAADPGASFDYRGYLARHNAQSAPLGSLNPLAGEWGTAVQNRPDPANNTFVDTVDPLVYWQDIVVQVRTYARQTYNKEILITANGIFPFVDFQTVGLYDWNQDGPGPEGFNYVPVVNGHYDGTVSFLSVLSGLKARSQRLIEAGGGTAVPLLMFLDWPTDSINRYYALPVSERQDYVKIFSAEAYSLGMMLAVPLATTTETNTATTLGMLGFFQQLRGFYESHASLFKGQVNAAGKPSVSAANVAAQLTTLPNGQTVLHLINHNYSAGVITQNQVAVSFPVNQAPNSVTLVSPDYTADVAVPFAYGNGTVSLTIDAVGSSVAVWVQ